MEEMTRQEIDRIEQELVRMIDGPSTVVEVADFATRALLRTLAELRRRPANAERIAA